MKAFDKYLLVLFVFVGINVLSQSEFSNYRSKWVKVADTVQIDSLSILPNSLQIEGLDSTNFISLDFEGKVVFKKLNQDSVLISYKVLPLNFTKPVFFRNPNDTLITAVSGLVSRNPYNFSKKELTREDLFGGQDLRKGGSISRGIRVGNNQDLSVNSSMNLQLSGSFQGVEISAAITDNNIPIQPQGNTQTLQEFDKVFVQFSKNGHRLIAGDFQTIESKDIFLKFNKKAQGISYEGKYKAKLFGENATWSVTTDAALSRGKFSRNEILGIEGNQGPYQLRGAENEQFIIILSGTERVYIDGKLMKRGMDNDYVIDYNTSELTFTTNQLITKDKRIVVEFQYSDQNYGRSLFHAGNEIKSKKGRFFFNIYSEQDMKFQQLQQSLSDANIDLLYNVGDSLQLAVSPKVDSVEYSANQVMYQKKDTIVDFVTHTIYLHSTDENNAFYSLGFSNVGQGNGNYVQTTSSANGRVYEWVAPVLGVKQGEYEPLVQLIAPKQQQMATIGAQYQVSKRTNVFLEGAFSNANQNLFASKHKSDDQGIALNSKVANNYSFSKNKNVYQIKTNLSYQLVNKNFSTIERFRSVEFDRDFNLGTPEEKFDEHIASFNSTLLKGSRALAALNASYVDRGDLYRGLKTGGTTNIELWKGAKLIGSGSLLQSEGLIQTSNFLRHKFALSQNIKAVTLKVWEEHEKNLVNQIEPDTLATTSFWYTVYGASSSLKKKRAGVELNWNQRTDFLPFNNELQKTTLANNIGAKFTFQGKKSSRFLWNTTYRTLDIKNNNLTAQEPENTILNRVEYKFNLWKGMFTSSSFFEVGAGSELKRQFAYIQVNPGQGTHMWDDFNEDGVQDLNEFVIPPDEGGFVGDYLRVYLPSTEFIKTYSNQFNQSINLTPSKFFKRDNRWGKFITRFNNQLILKMSQKTAKEGSDQFEVPFQNAIGDTSLISLSSSFRNTVYFNRSNPKFGANYTFSENESKSVLSNGFEARGLTTHAIDGRWNFLRKFTLRTKLELSDKLRTSELFYDQDYNIIIKSVEPNISYQKGASFRLKIIGEYKEKTNASIYGGELAIFRKIGSEITYNMLTKGRMSTQFSYIQTSFNGEIGSNSPLIFDMLEGFQVGTNFTWQVRYQRTFKNNFQLNLNYEGRSSETSKVVHTGTMQVQLLF